MGLIKSEIRDRARVLLNELIEGFWLNSQLENWADDSAIDISTKTHCYETSTVITLLTGTQLYTVTTDTLKLLGAVFNHKGLKKATPWMEGLQTAVQTGPPEYYFDIIDKVGFFPVPTTSENNKLVTIYHSSVTEDITDIPTKFKLPSVLFVTVMGLIKEKQYTKAGQLYQTYLQALNIDLVDVVRENIEQPPPQNQYILKLVGPQK